jgi:peptidoglycan biosynthesis protein MviN/MurJ (putative lipid II flippase)
MGPSRAVTVRALRRVGVSSSGEIIGRAVNIALPFVILGVHSVDLLTDLFYLALAIAFFVQGTLSNSVASIQVTELTKDDLPRSLRSFLAWGALAGLLAGVAAFWVVFSGLELGTAMVATASVTVAAAFGLLSAPAVAVLHAEHRYLMPGLTWAFRIVPLMAYVAWAPDTPALHWLLAGIALSDVVRAAVLLWLARGRLTLSETVPPLGFPVDAVYLLAGSSVAGLTPLAARWLASLGDPGSVSIFEAADRMYMALASLATIGIGNVILVYLARVRGTLDEHQAWRWVLRSAVLWSVLWLAIALTAGLGFPVFGWILPQQGHETVSDIRNTFVTLSLGIPAFVVGIVLSRRILTLGLARRLLPMAVAGLGITIFVGWLLLGPVGITGIALGVVVGQYLVLALMASALRNHGQHAHPRPV